MPWTTPDSFHVMPGYQPLMRELGLDAEAVFTHPDIRVWRSIPERENATLDAVRSGGSAVRLHIKRHRASADAVSPAEVEARGIRLLQQAAVPTVPLVGYGRLRDGRSFLITEDLAGYEPADKTAIPLADLLDSLAELTAKLHGAGLHHRDLYLCHFFVNADHEVRVIDAGRVKRLPGWPFRKRWVVKDLAQVCYSMSGLRDSAQLWRGFIERYVRLNGCYSESSLDRAVAAKVRRIARHDMNLRNKQPLRNVSIPE